MFEPRSLARVHGAFARGFELIAQDAGKLNRVWRGVSVKAFGWGLKLLDSSSFEAGTPIALAMRWRSQQDSNLQPTE